jgi:phytoene dehydrogenase-like protein
MDQRTPEGTIVVGGGLAGLAAAALVARGGQRVSLHERSPQLGGRAITQEEKGFRLNLGPHALYRAGAGIGVLRRLGLEPAGGMPKPSGGHAVRGGVAHTLPAGPMSLLATGLIGLGAKLEFGRLLGGLARIDPAPLARVPFGEWLDGAVRHPDVRAIVAALIRLATYTNAPALLSAGTAVRQLQLALAANVLYLDGGWQTLVDGLRSAAERAGAGIVAGARVIRVAAVPGGFTVECEDGSAARAAQVVLALAPGEAAALVDGPGAAELQAWAGDAVPVRTACLDVALSRLPRPRSTFALGIDRPLYLSVHSAVARLAPAEGALIQVARYLPAGDAGDPRADERELEGLLDLIQPGWRSVLVARRFLPRLTVANAVATASAGGTAGRPAPEVPGMPGLWLAGDWVGPEGLLADASLASAARAAERVLAAAASPAVVAA